MNDWTYYDQNDPQWNQATYDGYSIDDSGCGPTALAMAASDITGEKITPDMIASEAYNAGVWNSSSSWDLFPWFAKRMNFEYSNTTEENDLNGINDMLARGESVIASGISTDKKSPFTRAGHIVEIVARKANGNFLINDPRGKKYSGEYKPGDIVNDNSLLRKAWGYKKGSGKIKTISTDAEPNITKQISSKELYDNAGKGTGLVYNNIGENTTKVIKETSAFNNVSIPESIKEVLNDTGITDKLHTQSELDYVRSCLESMNVVINELKSINVNTKETANNISKIKVYSANEPVGTAAVESKTTNNKNNRYNKSKTISSPESNEYYIARKIASFNK